MSLANQIVDDIKSAMKSGDKLRLETLRSLRARILEFEKSGSAQAMTESDEQNILLSEAKKRKDAIAQYEQAGREELKAKEEAELAIIGEYLPAQLTEDEIKEAVQAIARRLGAGGPQDFGKVMGAAMKELRGKADGARVQQLVKTLLQNE